MKKAINRDKQYVSQLVCVTTHPDAQVYTIASLEGNNAVLQWREGAFQTRCTHDRDSLVLPSLEQIENSIGDGALVSWCDIQQWNKDNQ
jgi:uncharacterized protein (DUF1810 family)